MSYKISKELFEAVVGFKVIEFYCKNEIQYYPADRERVRCIDWIPTLSGCEYNDFFFKCKEWAYNTGYEIISGYDGVRYICYYDKTSCYSKDYYIDQYSYKVADSEQQAVFDACQWILDKDKQ